MSEKYHKYLCSRAWWLKRNAVMKRAENMCEFCHVRSADHVHHLTYIRLYNENLDDLCAACSDCHDLQHGLEKTPLVVCTECNMEVYQDAGYGNRKSFCIDCAIAAEQVRVPV